MNTTTTNTARHPAGRSASRGAPSGRARATSRRGFAIAVVLWALMLAMMVMSTLQISAWRQAALGREAVARVRATWAARAGAEAVIARLQGDTLASQSVEGQALLDDLAQVGQGDLAGGAGATYQTVKQDPQGIITGVVDESSKINVNRMTQADWMLLDNMTDDVAAAIGDWIDADDDPSDNGAESESYSGLPYSYKPRNGPVQTLRELELVKGVQPIYLRGEDWNLNGILDPNENDGENSWPPDDANGTLDAGWSAYLTAASVAGGLAPGGDPLLDLTQASASDVEKLANVDANQAAAIVAYASGTTTTTDATTGATTTTPSGTMEAFISTPLATLAQQAQQAQGASGNGTTLAGNGRVANLTRDQLTALYDGCQIGAATLRMPGKININTVPEDTLNNYISELTDDQKQALLSYRDGMSGEIASIIDLQDMPGMTTANLATMAAMFCTRSNVFTVVSRGVDKATKMQVEIQMEIDRTTLPVTIRNVRVR